MTSSEHTLLKMNRNDFIFWAHGKSIDLAYRCLHQRLKTMLVGSDLFSANPKTNDPQYFENLTIDVINEAKSSGNLKEYSLGGMADVLDGKAKISEIISPNVDADTVRVWVYYWTRSVRSITGLSIEHRSKEDLRWLITDDGYYIEGEHFSSVVAVSVEDKNSLICQFDSHILIARKFGASHRVLNELNEFGKKLTTDLNESKGDYSHLTIEELEEKLLRRSAAEEISQQIGNKFHVRGPTSSQLAALIASRKSGDL